VRKAMFVPSNFTVENVSKLHFIDCATFENSKANDRVYNCFKHTFTGEEEFNGDEWDVYLEDSKAKFLDKLEASITGEEQLLL
jgi:hypothetical protein